MRHWSTCICPVGVQTSYFRVLSAGNGGVEAFDRFSAHRPGGDFGAELPACCALGAGKRGTVTQHQCAGAGV